LRPRIYIDTSVIGGCVDDEFSPWSLRLFDEFRRGEKVAVISDLTRRELEKAPEKVRMTLESIPEAGIENVFLDEEAIVLARKYIDEGVVVEKHWADAQHIAIAVVEKVDLLVSWNFQHVVNINRIRAFNSVNIKLGHQILEIRSPREVVDEEEI